jgi:hypothetical protein
MSRMTMNNKKRDRRTGTGKSPHPSPNQRDLKQSRSVQQDAKNKTKDEEMKEPPEIAKNDLLKQFNKAIAVDWKRWITQDDATGWEISHLPGPSTLWTGLSPAKQKEPQGLIKNDLLVTKWPLVLKDGWKDIKTLFGVDQHSPFGDRLSKDLLQAKDTMFGKRHVRAFKCMLALSKTPADQLPMVKLLDGNIFVPSTVIAELWV